MFKHQGNRRSLKHNLKIASLLSFVAGIVNVAGFLAVQRLTTNVTGHFAFFVDEVFKLNFWDGFVYFLYIFYFFLGAFTSSFLMELTLRKNENFVHLLPVSIEILILFVIALRGEGLVLHHANVIACTLLFAMGLQNSLVTRISNSTVRTTHLTGLFTDLGIDLSQLFFSKDKGVRAKHVSLIKLRFTIISFFFIGGIVGGIFYTKMGLQVLFLGAIALLLGLIYDNIKFYSILLRRRYKN